MTKIRVGINGFGRMGRLVTRVLVERDDVEIAIVNEIKGDATVCAHLLMYDSTHGQWKGHTSEVADHGAALLIDGARVACTAFTDHKLVPWKQHDVDVVIECTGALKSAGDMQGFFEVGVPKVVVSRPVPGEASRNIVVGVNDELITPDHHLYTAASCTTNCLAPVVKVMKETFGIRHGMITTIHNVTNTQVIMDLPKADLRRARSCLGSLIPTTTGSAKAIAMIFPDLAGKLDGVAVRVPITNASITDCVFELERETTVEEVNAALESASLSAPLKGILGFETLPLVSVDYTNDPRSGVVDARSTMVTDKTLCKLLVFYDNEMGYVQRMAQIAARVVLEGRGQKK